MDKRASCQFRCEGCGERITLLGLSEPPGHQLCSVCKFINTHMTDDPEDFWQCYLNVRRNRDAEHETQELAAAREHVRQQRALWTG